MAHDACRGRRKYIQGLVVKLEGRWEDNIKNEP
jgi:hypothetical protein